MTDREEAGLRGRVKNCIGEIDYAYPDRQWVMHRQHTFSPRGDLLEPRHQNPNGSEWSVVCRYNEHGQIVEKDQANQRLSYVYDTLGRLERILSSSAQGDARIIENVQHAPDGTKMSTSYPLLLSDTGRKSNSVSASSMLHVSLDAVVIMTSFDASGRPIRRVFYDADDRVIRRVAFRYAESGLLLEEGELVGEAIREDFRNVYRYDAAGRKTEVAQRWGDGLDGSRLRFAYNDHGDMVEKIIEQDTGKERDAETGLDYFGARYFSGAQGRFTSPDWSAKPQPVPYANLRDPQTLNLYGYVRNNPLKNHDPDGHVCIFGIGDTCTAPPLPPPPPQAPLLNGNGSIAQGPQQPVSVAPPATPILGGGVGVTLGATAAVGVGLAGAASTGGGTAAVFANDQSGASASAGLSAAGGVMATAGQSSVGMPQQPSNSTAIGAFAGAGGGILLTNAGTNQTLATTQTTYSFDVGLVFGGSIQVSAGNGGVTAISITLGPAIGLAFTQINTTTIATGSQ